MGTIYSEEKNENNFIENKHNETKKITKEKLLLIPNNKYIEKNNYSEIPNPNFIKKEKIADN